MRLLGRDHELDDVDRRLHAGRLVTLMGPGGVRRIAPANGAVAPPRKTSLVDDVDGHRVMVVRSRRTLGRSARAIGDELDDGSGKQLWLFDVNVVAGVDDVNGRDAECLEFGLGHHWVLRPTAEQDGTVGVGERRGHIRRTDCAGGGVVAQPER